MTAVYSDEWLEVRGGHALDELRAMAEASVDCVVTSPPYFGLRDYGTAAWAGGDPGCTHLLASVRPRSSRPRGGANMGTPYHDAQDAGTKTYRDRCRRCGAVRVEPTVWGGDAGHAHAWGPVNPQRGGGSTRSTLGEASGGHGVSDEGRRRSVERQVRAPASSAFCACGAWHGALGLEPTPELYVEHLVEVMREVRRVLKPTGTLWLNLGDSYAANRAYQVADGKWRDVGNGAAARVPAGLKPKDLVGVPWRAAFALQADGWWLRRDVIWAKPNSMPESVDDRPTSSHEYLFMLTKAERYYFDMEAVREPFRSSPTDLRKITEQRTRVGGKHAGDRGTGRTEPGSNMARHPAVGRVADAKQALAALERPGGDGRGDVYTGFNGRWDEEGATRTGRSLRSVWEIPTAPYPGAHFAVFPAGLVEKPVLASTSARGVCPECGAPWRRRAEDRWAPGCGCGWGGDPADLDLIESPLRDPSQRQDPDERLDWRLVEGRRGLGRERGEAEGRWLVTRHEQRAIARQLRAWDENRKAGGLDDVRRWLDGEPGEGDDAWRHYLRTDASGGRVPPRELVGRWAALGWLEVPEPPDWTGAPEPVPATVMDPFAGSGTVGVVANRLSRRAVLVDLNPEYLRQQLRRNAQVPLGLGE